MTNEEMLLLAAAGGVGRRQMSHTEVLVIVTHQASDHYNETAEGRSRHETAVDGQQRANTNMGVLRVMSKRGDDQVSWDTVAYVAGDPEAVAAVAEAERLFTCARDAGVVAFAVDPTTKKSVRLVAFDVLQPQIVLIPRFIGG